MWPLLFLGDAGLMNVFLPTVTAILIFIFTIRIIKYLTSDPHIPIRDTTKQHNWQHAKLLLKVFDYYAYLHVLSREKCK
jgi:hypothetical protein